MNRLDFSRDLAHDAGRLAHSKFGQSATSMKGRHDVVTAMDRDVERFIRGAIAAWYPDDTVIGEEEGGVGQSERVWLMDPIDGTANYARGIPHYCVSIAFLERLVPTVGVIYDPSHDWLYAAARGEGALGLADVAAGRSEAYCELHINAWDCAAGILLVREAGGHTNEFFAGDGLTAGSPIIATNDGLCAKLASLIGIAIRS